MRKILIPILAACLLGAASARASTNVFNFDSDPTGILTIFKTEEANAIGQAGVWFPTDGSTLEVGTGPATNGYLQITAGTNASPGNFGQRAVILFDDFDNGLVVAGFKFQCDVRIGAGTALPADGFSLNYARGNDPVIVNNDGSGFATSVSGTEVNLPEEGTQTGLSVCFDAWDSGGGDVIGLTIRVDNVIRTNFPLPTVNGACADPTSIQTGTNTLGLAGLCWQSLYVELTTGGLLNVSYKGATLLTNYAVNFAPSPGRLIFAGRVGGNNQYQDVDNIRLVTVPSPKPVVGPTTANANGLLFSISDSGATTPDTNTLTVKLDGAAVTPTLVSQSGNIGGGNGVTLVVYQSPSLVLASGSTHTSVVHFTGSTFSGPVDATNIFTIPPYTFMDAAEKAPGAVNTNLTGFFGRIHQLPIARYPGNGTVALDEKQLADGFIDPSTGLPYASITVGGVSAFTDDDVINWSQDVAIGGAPLGDFSTAKPSPADWPDEAIPGTDRTVSDPDNIAAELVTILNLPVGAYEFGVNHDDSYKLSVGPEPRNMFAARILASNDANADNAGIRIVVTNAGFYPFRLLWGENGGGAQLEFYFIDFATGQKVLINDRRNPLFIASYRDTAALTLPYLVSTLPEPADSGISSTNPIVVKFQDGTAGTIVAGSIKINGQTPTVSNTGGVTTATLAGVLPPGPNTVTLVYSTTLAGPTTNTWTFDVVSTKTDITAPGDPITVYNPFGGSTPAAEGLTNVIANNAQKYLNFGDGSTLTNQPLGFVVVPSVGPTVVTGLRHFTANDAPERDPAFVTLEGSFNGGTSWNPIFSGPVTLPLGRNGTGETPINPTTQFSSEVAFPNTVAYSSYRWYLTKIRGNANLMQIGEVELLGVPGTLPPFLSISRSGAQVTITASQAGTLQAAPGLTGWTNVGPISAGSPLLVAPSAPSLFYRLSVP